MRNGNLDKLNMWYRLGSLGKNTFNGWKLVGLLPITFLYR